MRRVLVGGGAVALLAAIAFHLWSQFDEVSQLRRLSADVLLGSVILLLGSHITHNESMLAPLRAHLPRLSFWEFFLVRTGGFVVGAAVPVAGGAAVRLAYLRRLGLTFTDFARATLLSNVLAVVAAACLALPATGALWVIAGSPPAAALWLVVSILVLGVGALVGLRSLPRLTRYPWLSPWLPAVTEAAASRRVMRRVFWTSIARHVCSFLAFGWLYAALSDVPAGFLAGGLVYTLTSPIRMVHLTPGNVGVNEWAVAVAGRALAFDLTTGLLVGGVYRVASLAAQGLGVVLGWALSGAGGRSAARP